MKLKLSTLLMAVIVAASFTFPALASNKTETRSPISSVILNTSSLVEEGEDSGYIEVSTSDSGYSIGNTEWTKPGTGGFKVGDQPQVKVYLHARSGNYFDKSLNAKKVVVNGAETSSVKKENNNETLVVTLKLGKVKGTLEEAENVEWIGYPLGKAKWDKVASANAYELKLYRDTQPVYSVEKSVGTNFDFYPYMTQAGTYQFRVRAIPANSEEEKYLSAGDWTYSDTMDLTADETANAKFNNGTSINPVTNPADLGWKLNPEGWIYRLQDGSVYRNSWQVINDKWYYFGYDGIMLTGWKTINGKNYYLSSNGDMQVGWFQYDREWYFLNPSSGEMMSGWNLSNGIWYYMDPSSGKMKTGWLLDRGQWYYLDPNQGGAMARNTTIDGHFLNSEGVWVQ